MSPLLYDELVPWYRLLDPPADHADEVASYVDALCRTIHGEAHTLLELGSGAGHNAVHLKHRFEVTLSDMAPAMLALSRELHPECDHHLADMRTLRLGRLFDAVLVHDAIMYMTTEDDLSAVIATAAAHLRPGGAAVFAPDCTRDNFREHTDLIEEAAGDRALRCLAWAWDPDPHDSTFVTEYAFLLRDGVTVQAVHDRHLEGLFSQATWLRLLDGGGFDVTLFERPLDEEGAFDQVFVGRRR